MRSSPPPGDREPRAGPTLDDFVGEAWVACPRCERRALVRFEPTSRRATLSCGPCGHSRSLEVAGLTLGEARDPFFGLPLWLRIPCAGHELWAFNAAHLRFLEQHVSSKDRKRAPRGGSEPRNRLLASRLPRWMQSAANREAVVAAIRKLLRRLEDAT